MVKMTISCASSDKKYRQNDIFISVPTHIEDCWRIYASVNWVIIDSGNGLVDISELAATAENGWAHFVNEKNAFSIFWLPERGHRVLIWSIKIVFYAWNIGAPEMLKGSNSYRPSSFLSDFFFILFSHTYVPIIGGKAKTRVMESHRRNMAHLFVVRNGRPCSIWPLGWACAWSCWHDKRIVWCTRWLCCLIL